MTPGRLDVVRARALRWAADARRTVIRGGSARPALTTLGRPPRNDLDRWNAITAARHARYRAEHEPAPGRVAVVCVSMRPKRLAAVADAIASQLTVEPELVFVVNAPGFDDVEIGRRLEPIGAVEVVRPPAGTSLGAALNLGLAATTARFVAKFDDDDIYGPHHLADSLRAHRFAGAGVVGKHTYYAELTATGARYLRFPANEFRYSGTLAGGTLVIDRDRVGDLAFEDVSLGEDRRFLQACHRRGISTFSADRFNFVQRRGENNTWSITDEAFLAGAMPVDPVSPTHSPR